MALKFRIDQSEFDALPEDVRATYYAKDDDGDGYTLDIEPPPEQRALKHALDRTRQELRDTRAVLAERAEIFGTADPVEQRRMYDAALTRIAAASEPMTDESLKATLAQMESEHQAAIAALDAKYKPELAALSREILNLSADMLMRDAMLRCDVIAPDLLAPHLRQHVRVTGDPLNGELAVSVVDPKSCTVRTRPDGSPLGIGDVLREMQILSPSLSRCFADPIAHRNMLASRNGNGNGGPH